MSYLSTTSWPAGQAQSPPRASEPALGPTRETRRIRYWQLQAVAALLCQILEAEAEWPGASLGIEQQHHVRIGDK